MPQAVPTTGHDPPCQFRLHHAVARNRSVVSEGFARPNLPGLASQITSDSSAPNINSPVAHSFLPSGSSRLRASCTQPSWERRVRGGRKPWPPRRSRARRRAGRERELDGAVGETRGAVVSSSPGCARISSPDGRSRRTGQGRRGALPPGKKMKQGTLITWWMVVIKEENVSPWILPSPLDVV